MESVVSRGCDEDHFALSGDRKCVARRHSRVGRAVRILLVQGAVDRDTEAQIGDLHAASYCVEDRGAYDGIGSLDA